ncbi:MAG: ROK family protein [Coprobacillus sp.]|nr:ROK family protein [Coprobacillus sp.]
MKQVISLDIGGTNLRAALVDSDYHILNVVRMPNRCYGDKKKFYSNVIEIIQQLEPDFDDVINISLGVPGRVRNDGFIEGLANVGISDINLVRVLNRKFHKDVYIRNDAEMGLLAEAVLGEGKGYDGVYFITISTGIGGAFAFKGHLKNYGKEIGHIPVLIDDNYYELEKMCSGEGIKRLCKLYDLDVSSASEFFSMVRSSEKKSLVVFEKWLEIFSRLLRYVKRVYNPDIFTFTGGVFKNKDLIFSRLKEMNPDLNMVECYFREDAGLIGSAVYGFSQMEEEE